MGSVIYAYRHHLFHGTRPLSQELAGGWLGVTQAQLSRIEHGPPIYDLHRLIHWAQTLQIPARYLWFDLPGQPRGAFQPQAVLPDTERTIEVIQPPDQLGEGGVFPDGDAMMVWLVMTIEGRPVFVPVRLPRRRVLAAGGAGLLATLTDLLDPDEFARVKAMIVTPSRADLATVRHLEALLAHYRGLDDQVGPRRLLAPVQASLDLVDHLREDAQPPVRQALLSVAGQYEQLTGSLWKDSGEYALAERAYDRALARATEAGDHALARYVLTCKSDLALQEGNAGTARTLAQAAQSGKGLTPAVRAFAAMKEARAEALEGERGTCRRKLDESAVLLTESAVNGRADEPPWIYHFAEQTLATGSGICLTDLGEAGVAIEIFDHALAALPAERVTYRAYCLLWSAKAHAGNHDPEQAAVVAREGAVLAIQTGSRRVLKKLYGLHAQFREAHKDVQAVRDLAELLR
jgi:tetratricopeptide (TPR) repeat protein